jgi:hypothetical protein
MCAVGLARLFENQLKQKNPNLAEISYGTNDISKWIDTLPDLAALTFVESIAAFNPQNKQWIKEALVKHLKRQA